MVDESVDVKVSTPKVVVEEKKPAPKVEEKVSAPKAAASKSKPITSIVPVDKTNVENAATVTTAFLGLAMGGPVGALFFAALGKYLAKKDNESGVVVRGIGKSVVEVYNFFMSLEEKYHLAEKATTTIDETSTKLAKDSEGVATVKKSATEAISKIKELNSEFDLVGKGKQALEVAATLSESALEKVEELNAKVPSFLLSPCQPSLNLLLL